MWAFLLPLAMGIGNTAPKLARQTFYLFHSRIIQVHSIILQIDIPIGFLCQDEETHRMKINKKIVLYFGLGGILPVIYFVGEGLYEGKDDPRSLVFYTDILIDLVVSYGMTTSISLVVLLCLEKVNQIFPWEKNIWARFAADITFTPIVAAISVYPLAVLTFYIYHDDAFNAHILKNVIIAIVLDLLLVAVYEGTYFFKQWKQSLLKTERLEKENISSRFEALKNQINPHFLFNSLNTLSSLVHESAEKSEAFIDEFAKIYRYVLDNQESIAVSLKKELAFVESFMYLQKIRFGESLDSHIKIEASKLDKLVPTLSLQLLIENAIKHNMVTRSAPLKIKIHTENEFLIVENNLQRRKQVNNSTAIGLKNLRERYELITKRKPEFIVGDNSYIAKIPLIDKDEL